MDQSADSASPLTRKDAIEGYETAARQVDLIKAFLNVAVKANNYFATSDTREGEDYPGKDWRETGAIFFHHFDELSRRSDEWPQTERLFSTLLTVVDASGVTVANEIYPSMHEAAYELTDKVFQTAWEAAEPDHLEIRMTENGKFVLPDESAFAATWPAVVSYLDNDLLCNALHAEDIEAWHVRLQIENARLLDKLSTGSARAEKGEADVAQSGDQSKAVALLLGKESHRILGIASSDKTADEKMRAICEIDRRILGWSSLDLGDLLSVKPSAIRKTAFWKECHR